MWTTQSQPFGANHAPLLTGVSSIDGQTPVPVAVDPATGQLLTSASVSISGSTIPITGATTAIVTAIVDSSGNQISTFGGGTQYTTGVAVPGVVTGNALVFGSGGGEWADVEVGSPLPVTDTVTAAHLPTIDTSTATTATNTTNIRTDTFTIQGNQTNGTQLTQLVDSLGTSVNTIGNSLSVAEDSGVLVGVVWDEAVGTSEDANGNPQVMTFKLASATVAVIDLTYNSSSKLTHLLRTV